MTRGAGGGAPSTEPGCPEREGAAAAATEVVLVVGAARRRPSIGSSS